MLEVWRGVLGVVLRLAGGGSLGRRDHGLGDSGRQLGQGLDGYGRLQTDVLLLGDGENLRGAGDRAWALALLVWVKGWTGGRVTSIDMGVRMVVGVRGLL